MAPLSLYLQNCTFHLMRYFIYFAFFASLVFCNQNLCVYMSYTYTYIFCYLMSTCPVSVARETLYEKLDSPPGLWSWCKSCPLAPSLIGDGSVISIYLPSVRLVIRPYSVRPSCYISFTIHTKRFVRKSADSNILIRYLLSQVGLANTENIEFMAGIQPLNHGL